MDDYIVDTRRVRNAFNSAAKDYDANSLLQQTVTDRLVESFEQINIKPSSILDLGAGTGYGSKKLKQQFKKARYYQLDLSAEMLKISRKQTPIFFSKNHFVCADANNIPLPDKRFDVVFSSLMLQWCNNSDAVFAEINRVLKPGGVFIFASFGPDTLKELRESWRKVDDQIHVNAFSDMHDIGDALIRNGLDAPVLSVEHIVLTYTECKNLMRELKIIGAHNINEGRRKTLTGKRRIEELIKHYESYRENNRLPATYEVIYGHAWKPHVSTGSKGPNIQTVSLESLKQGLEKRKQN
jgi:malonyl-CoA O-methyltransferase